jgi:hypothetical protein
VCSLLFYLALQRAAGDWYRWASLADTSSTAVPGTASTWTQSRGQTSRRPWLSVYIHDSDIATVRYEPHGPGSGTAYLGCTPRTYFDDESASEPTDVLREAEGLALWLARQQNGNDAAELRELIASSLAGDFQEQSGENTDDGDGADDLDDAEIFVEVKVSKFLTAVGLPVPHELSRL